VWLRRVLFALALVTAAGAGKGNAADFCRLELRFRNQESSAPIPGVHLRLENSALGLHRDAVGGPDGRVLLLDLETGFWKAEALPEGYQWFSISSLRCVPEGLIRLEVLLEPTDADEGVSLGDAPEIDPASAEVLFFQPLPEVALPGGMASGSVRTGESAAAGGPRAFRRRDAMRDDPEPGPPLWPRLAPGSGFLELGIGTGAAGPLVRNRGASSSEDLQLPLLFDWVHPLSSGGRVSIFASAGIRRADLRSAFGREIGKPISRFESRRDSGVLALDLESSPGRRNSVEFIGAYSFLNADDEAGTLYSLDEPPGFDREHRRVELELRGSRLLSVGTLLYGSLAWSRGYGGIEAAGGETISQDLSPEGLFSSGFGKGVYFGPAGGIPDIREENEFLDASIRLSVSPTPSHLLDFDLDWSRDVRVFRPLPSVENPDRAASRMRYSGAGEGNLDVLLPAEGGRGISSELRFSLQDLWRLAPAWSLRLALGGGVWDFDAGKDRPGIHFNPGRTLSGELALVWDFAGGGRSRAWLSWKHRRPEIGESIRLRLAGSLPGAAWSLDDTSGMAGAPEIRIDSALEPPKLDLLAVGAERELLAHLRVGAALTFESLREESALMRADEFSPMLLGIPGRGKPCALPLERETTRAALWLRKTLSSGWRGLLTLGWSGQYGSWNGDPMPDLTRLDEEFSSGILLPGSLEHAEGRLDGDRRFRIDLEGSYFFSSGVVLGGRFHWGMGAPLSRLGALQAGYGLEERFVERRGSAGRGPSNWQMDVNLLVPLRDGFPDLRIEVLNLFFQRKAAEIDQRWSLLRPDQIADLSPEEQQTPGSWGEPLRYQPPPEIRLSLLWRF